MSKKKQTKRNATKNQKCLYCKKWFDEKLSVCPFCGKEQNVDEYNTYLLDLEAKRKQALEQNIANNQKIQTVKNKERIKKRNEKISFLIFTSAFLALILLSIGLAIRNNHSNKLSANYDDYKQYEISYKQIMRQPEDEYFVYFYSETCTACEQVKTTIFQYLSSDLNSTAGRKLYLVNMDKTTNMIASNEDEINILDVTNVDYNKNYDAIKIYNFPCLIDIASFTDEKNKDVNRKVMAYYEGVSKVKNGLQLVMYGK
jgi:RNA polymerase subunit RPABC4/transcription elongation factor Spt4